MKRLKKIAKWFGITLLLIIATLSIAVATRQRLHYDAPYPQIKASADTAVINRGKHLIYSIAHCADCHSTANSDSLLNLGLDVPLSGGRAFKLPLGTIYSRNITSHDKYGIGKQSDQEIARSLRYGVHPDGTAIYDFMPFHNLSDSDLTAVISYLRTQKPVAAQKPNDELNILGYTVKAFLVKPVGPSENIPAVVKPDTTAAYGKYLVMNVANCGGCHTQRSVAGEYTGKFLAGGNPMDGLVPPNLTPDSSSRIFGWSEQIFINRFRMGKLIPASHMPWNTFKRMERTELKAIYKYLQTVEPVRTVAVRTNSAAD
ncbi:MAG: c-type cytochrome [Williamsia sp.]|nr:c-type cytochrome [Williamsia sp.]